METLRPWIDPALAVICGVSGVAAGLRCSRWRAPWWLAGFFIPLALVVALGAARRWNELLFMAPFSWVAGGRRQYLLFAVSIGALLTTPLSRLPRRRDRTYVVLFLLIAASGYGVAPLLLPAVLRGRHEALATHLDPNGVCRQLDSYTCGPAAAVTGLAWLGVPSSLSDLTIGALTTPFTGTPPDLLCQAIEERHRADGVTCEYRRFRDASEIPPRGVTLAVMKLSFLIDHWVAVRSVSTDTVTIGDPLTGIRELGRKEFERRWRRTGIVLRRGKDP